MDSSIEKIVSTNEWKNIIANPEWRWSKKIFWDKNWLLKQHQFCTKRMQTDIFKQKENDQKVELIEDLE